MRQSAKRLSSLVLSLILILVAFVIFFSFAKPAYQEVQTIRAEKESRQAFIDSKRNIIKQVQNLIKAYEEDAELKDAQAAVELSFPAKSEIADALTQISGLLKLNNLTLESVNISEIAAPQKKTSTNNSNSISAVKAFNKVSFDVDLLGTYENFKKFLGNLEANIRIFDIEQLDLRPLATKGTNLYSASLKINAYYQN